LNFCLLCVLCWRHQARLFFLPCRFFAQAVSSHFFFVRLRPFFSFIKNVLHSLPINRLLTMNSSYKKFDTVDDFKHALPAKSASSITTLARRPTYHSTEGHYARVRLVVRTKLSPKESTELPLMKVETTLPLGAPGRLQADVYSRTAERINIFLYNRGQPLMVKFLRAYPQEKMSRKHSRTHKGLTQATAAKAVGVGCATLVSIAAWPVILPVAGYLSWEGYRARKWTKRIREFEQSLQLFLEHEVLLFCFCCCCCCCCFFFFVSSFQINADEGLKEAGVRWGFRPYKQSRKLFAGKSNVEGKSPFLLLWEE
jgi:hypothetical protein